MTSNDLESQNKFFVFFWQFSVAKE